MLDDVETQSSRLQRKRGGKVPLTLLRDGEELEIEPLLACAHRTSLRRQCALAFWGNANRGDHSKSRGEQWILITSGLVEFARDENDVASVIAREHAHRLSASRTSVPSREN